MARILKGKPVADSLAERIAMLSCGLQEKGIRPTLGIVRIGENPDDLAYERGIERTAERANVFVRKFELPADVSQDDALSTIEAINADESIHGCLLFRPLPMGLDEDAICNAIHPRKDVDGATLLSLAGVFSGANVGFCPATAQACMELIRYYDIQLEGKKVAVIGRSLVIGRPVALLLLNQNATVTMAHSRSRDVEVLARDADVVVCATGRARAFGTAFFRPGQQVIDVGMNVASDGSLCGDVDYDEVESIVEAITPVPGGVGSVTSAVILEHTVLAANAK